MKKKVMIAVGGTGGHVYPALSLAKNLHKADPSISIMFIGAGLKKNKFFEEKDYLHESVEASPVSQKNPFQLLNGIKKILKGIWQSRRILKTFKPDIIIGFGSYHTFPALVAAKTLSIPMILHEANSVPGKVNRFLSKHALAVGIHFPETASLIRGNAVEVGIPLRDGYQQGSVSKQMAKDYFFLKDDRITVLIFGGSQGAKKINEIVSEAITMHYSGNKDALQVLHFTGDKDSVKDLEALYASHDIVASVKDFEKRMDLAWQAADTVISRAGAMTIAEQLEFEVPGILIPYPFASDQHQDKNAEFMTKTVGGALTFLEKDLNPEILGKKISTFLNHDQILLNTMKESMRQYKKRSRSEDLCSLTLKNLWKKPC